MDGMNHAFKVNPAYFMAHTALTMNPSCAGSSADPRELRTGIQHFDIVPSPIDGLADLKFYINAGMAQHVGDRIVGQSGSLDAGGIGAIVPKAIGVIWRAAEDERPPEREAPIKAYWLPYQADKTYETTLTGGANYFFTAGLSGCSVIISGDPTAPRVAHVNRTEEGGDLYNRMVKPAIGPDHAPHTSKENQTNRQFMFQELKTKVAARAAARDTSDDVLGYCKWGEQYRELAGVFGVRNQGTGAWKFYYQCYRSQPAPAEHATLGLIVVRDGPLRPIV